MTPFEIVKNKLHEGMVQGQMHLCLRDVGRLAGGYAAAGELGIHDLMELADIAGALSQNPREGREKWESAVAYGRNEPVSWDRHQRDEGRALDWNDTIGGRENDDLKVVDPRWVEDEHLEEPDDWNPVNDLSRYLSTLFDGEDHVAYVTEAYHNEEAGRWLPKRGVSDRTAGELIASLSKCKGDMGAVIGDVNKEVGAWIRFNPLDGSGYKDANVTKYRFALVECDNIPIARQYALMKELELPIGALVHSGGKSLHAIVRIEADTFDQYRERVDFLYEVCKRNGLTMDRANRNPSRLSRMPGVMRNGRRQWLVGTHLGKGSWGEWKEWIEDINDDLPEIEDLEVSEEEPELAPELIEGVLREGHKMLLAGPSKAGKSFALIGLAIAFSKGSEWMGWKVSKGRCLYVNLELDRKSAKHRVWKIHKRFGIEAEAGMIDIWNLRGNSCSLKILTPKLIRRAQKKGYKAVIIDPIYKVLTGDENSAAEMAEFCNYFDRICLQLGAATIYCHHHSKGAQGQKSSRDRSSGSGVFARDPDAIIDMIELQLDESRRKKILDRWASGEMGKIMDKESNWRALMDQDDQTQAGKLIQWARKEQLGCLAELQEVYDQFRERADSVTGWRLETTLREFKATRPRRVFFDYPVHQADVFDLLKDAKAEGEEPPWVQEQRKKQEAKKKKADEDKQSVANAVEACKDGERPARIKDVAEYLSLTDKGARAKLKRHGFTIEDGQVFKSREGAKQ